MKSTFPSAYIWLKKHFTIQWRLLCVCYILVTVPTIILGLLSYHTFSLEMEKNAEANLQAISHDWYLTARVYKEQLDRVRAREIELAQKQVSSVATNTMIMIDAHDAVRGDTDESLVDSLMPLFEKLALMTVNENGYLTIFDNTGALYIDRNELCAGKISFDGRGTENKAILHEILETLKKNPGRIVLKDYWGKEEQDKSERQRISAFLYYEPRELVICATTYYDDFYSYALKNTLQEELKQKMAEHPIGELGYLWVLNSAGEYIVSKDRLRDGENIFTVKSPEEKYPAREIIEQALKLSPGESSVHRYHWQNDQEKTTGKMAVARYFSDWDWVIGTSAYEVEYLAGLEKIRTYIFVVCLIAICLGSAIAYALARFIAQPIERLEEMSRAAARGDLSQDVSVLIAIGGEIGRLAESFGFMMASLKGKIWEVELALKNRKKINIDLQNEIAERKQIEDDLRENEEKFRTLFDSANDAIFIMKGAAFIDCNLKTLDMFACTREQIIGQPPYKFSPEYQPDGSLSHEKAAQKMSAAIDGEPQQFEWQHIKYDGTPFSAEVTLNAIVLHGDTFLQAIVRDISDRVNAEEERLQLEKDLSHARKLESIGTLAAGIAHEINTPVQFVGDNVKFFAKAVNELMSIIAVYKRFWTECAEKGYPFIAENEEEFKKLEKHMLFIEEELPEAIAEAQAGLDRVTIIVNAMKNYSHINQDEKVAANINEAIESTVIVARNEWKYVAKVDLDFDASLPLVHCYLAEINQVVMNVLINATHAIKEVVGEEPKELGAIGVRTYRDGPCVVIAISDTGGGVSESVRGKIFDPFFTTKEVGKGTGQGLSIAYQIVVEKHHGRIWFETADGVGTTFFIALPCDGVNTNTTN